MKTVTWPASLTCFMSTRKTSSIELVSLFNITGQVSLHIAPAGASNSMNRYIKFKFRSNVLTGSLLVQFVLFEFWRNLAQMLRQNDPNPQMLVQYAG